MEQNKCPNCSSNMTLIRNADGTESYKCHYCGNIVPIRAKTTTDKIFSFLHKVTASMNESEYDRDKRMAEQIQDPVRRARALEEIEARLERELHAAHIQEERRLQKLEKYNEKRQKSLEKYRQKLEGKR